MIKRLNNIILVISNLNHTTSNENDFFFFFLCTYSVDVVIRLNHVNNL